MKVLVRLTFIFYIISVSFFTSCKFGIPALLWGESDADSRSGGGIRTLTGSGIPDSGTNGQYSFVIITDVHFGAVCTRHDAEFLSWFEKQLAADDETLRPRFVVCLGDTADSGLGDELDDYVNELVAPLVSLGKKAFSLTSYHVYTIIGNHDLYNNGWTVWKKKVYPYTSFYRFNTCADVSTAGFGWYFLDSGNGTLGNTELEDFESRVADDDRPKIVFIHYPVYCGGNFLYSLQNTMERNRLLTAFADNNVKQVFEGHTHMSKTFDFGSFSERIIPSYLYSSVCCLVTVNEEIGTVSSSLVYF